MIIKNATVTRDYGLSKLISMCKDPEQIQMYQNMRYKSIHHYIYSRQWQLWVYRWLTLSQEKHQICLNLHTLIGQTGQSWRKILKLEVSVFSWAHRGYLYPPGIFFLIMPWKLKENQLPVHRGSVNKFQSWHKIFWYNNVNRIENKFDKVSHFR